MTLQYDHIGIIVDKPKPGMRYFPEFKCWTSDYTTSLYRIEWICFDKGCEFDPLIQSVSHVGFLVKDIQKAIERKKILFKPVLFEGTWMAFIEEDGAPIEFFQPEK